MTTLRGNLPRVLHHETPDWLPVTGHGDPCNQPSHPRMDPDLAAPVVPAPFLED
jgi:hypothetical protein